MSEAIRMSKTISVSRILEEKLVKAFDDELNYHINESGCPEAYQTEITAKIELLKLLGFNDMAKRYEKQNENAMAPFKKKEAEAVKKEAEFQNSLQGKLYNWLDKATTKCGCHEWFVDRYSDEHFSSPKVAFETFCDFWCNDWKNIENELKKAGLKKECAKLIEEMKANR